MVAAAVSRKPKTCSCPFSAFGQDLISQNFKLRVQLNSSQSEEAANDNLETLRHSDNQTHSVRGKVKSKHSILITPYHNQDACLRIVQRANSFLHLQTIGDSQARVKERVWVHPKAAGRA